MDKQIELSSVYIHEMVKFFVSNKEKQDLGKNPYFEKPILYACANNKTKVEIEETHRYPSILLSLMNKFRDIFPYDLPNGLPPSRDVHHSIEVILGLKPIDKHA